MPRVGSEAADNCDRAGEAGHVMAFCVGHMKISKIIVLTMTLLISSPAFSQRRGTSIHSVDFANFTYPWTAGLTIRGGTKTFTLRDGKRPEVRDTRGHVEQIGVYLEEVSYGDVTGDGIEEAIIFMSILTGVSAMPGQVYIYTLRGDHPKLLWHFSTGDRAENGFRKVYADRGNLVVELNGPKRMGEGLCCPERFTRTRYQWRDGRFRRKGRKEIKPILD
jgi:hypothetical protein